MDINGGSWYINVIHLYHSFNTMHFISTGIDIHMVIPPTNIMHTNIHIYTYIYNNIHIYIYQWHSIYTSIPTNIGFTTRYYWILTDNGTITQINSFCLRAAGMSKHQGFDHQDRADGPKIWACLDLEIWYLPVKQIRIGICDQNIMKDTPNNVILRSV